MGRDNGFLEEGMTQLGFEVCVGVFQRDGDQGTAGASILRWSSKKTKQDGGGMNPLVWGAEDWLGEVGREGGPFTGTRRP